MIRPGTVAGDGSGGQRRIRLRVCELEFPMWLCSVSCSPDPRPRSYPLNGPVMRELAPNTLEILRQVSTATLCTQLFHRGFRNVFIQGSSRVTRAPHGNLVGPAYTVRNIPAREDLDELSAFRNPEHPRRKSIESIPPGHVMVVGCRGEKRAASGGEILTTRLMKRGAAGLVSDGPVRDSAAIAALPFQVFCAGASAPLNLVHHHAVDVNVPIGCGGVAGLPGDVIVGDNDGVVNESAPPWPTTWPQPRGSRSCSRGCPPPPPPHPPQPSGKPKRGVSPSTQYFCFFFLFFGLVFFCCSSWRGSGAGPPCPGPTPQTRRPSLRTRWRKNQKE